VIHCARTPCGGISTRSRIANRRPGPSVGARMLTRRIASSSSSRCMRVLAGLIAAVTLAATLPAQEAPGAGSPQGPTACPIMSASTGDTARRAAPDTASRAPQRSTASENPAIVLYAAATAREVRFASQPRITVRLCGAVTDSVRVIERRNLPDPVQPGTTYRDIFIAVEIIGHLHAECLARRITGQAVAQNDVCASATVRDTSRPARLPSPARRPPS
jgi:hypothetical protein